MKICIITPSLGLGGAERAAAVQSIMLSELGYQVHIVLISNVISFDFKGELYNLGALKDKSNTFFDKVKRVFLLKEYLKKNNFDFVIDNRLRTNSVINEVGICKYAYRNFKVLYVIHSSSYKNEIKENLFLKKWLLRDAYKIITVTKSLLDLIKPFHDNEKMKCIENAVDVESIRLKGDQKFNISFPYILFCGRLEEKCKNISLLIKGYAKSKVYKEGVKLIILGEGPDKRAYEELVISLKIKEHVHFKPFTINPFVYMKHALCLTLTSFYEGFGLVLIEALALETPVIAINCETGPSEIIEHNINGIMLETYNLSELSNALKLIANDAEKVSEFRKNTLVSVQKFDIKNISKKWKAILED
ncbi:MAG: glycosyltransferase [Algibacter sp.]|uniref:glycosyltransferase n=1 Tax=Algibacter sp. TaxID=1872428 RepID=UPI003298F4DB